MKTGTIALLFGKAGNRCSWCRTDLEIQNVRIGEMAHIIAKSEKGPRGEDGYEGDIDDYENLILLCNNHHEAIDKDPGQFPTSYVRVLKSSHESWVRSRLADVSQRYIDVNGLQALMRFLPLTQLNSALLLLPGTMHPAIMQTASTLEAFPIDNPQCRPFVDPNLEQYYVEFADRFDALMQSLSGPDFGEHYYEPTLNNGWILSRNLDQKKRAQVKEVIQATADAVFPALTNLLNHIRISYPEANLSSFGT